MEGVTIAPILVGFLGQTYRFSFPFLVVAPVIVVASITLFFYAPVLRESISSNMSVVH